LEATERESSETEIVATGGGCVCLSGDDMAPKYSFVRGATSMGVMIAIRERFLRGSLLLEVVLVGVELFRSRDR